MLELVAEGLENKEIAHRIGLSEQAVKEHVSALLHRLAVRNRAALAEIATELKIVGTTDLDPAWLSYVFQKSPVMRAIVRGPEHVFVAVNEAYQELSGEKDIIGRPFREVFPHGALELLVDVTDSARARQQLAELSAEQLAMLDLVPSGIVVLDRRGAVMKVNQAARKLLGEGPFSDVSSESAKTYRLRDAVTGRDVPSIDAVLARALGGEAVRELRVRMFLPALGRDALVRIDAEPLRTAGGDVRAVVAAMTELVEASGPI